MVAYSPELVAEICGRIAQGEPLARICREEGKPNRHMFDEWVRKYGHVEQLALARDTGYDSIAEDSRSVAAGITGYSTKDVQRDKLIIETDLKLLAVWSKRYAPKQQVEITGKDGDPLSIRLIEAQQRLMKNITPEPLTIENNVTIALDDIL